MEAALSCHRVRVGLHTHIILTSLSIKLYCQYLHFGAEVNNPLTDLVSSK